MSEAATALREPYRDALARYLAVPGEEALSLAYDLGRAAVRDGLGVLDLAELHQTEWLEVMARGTSVADLRRAAEAGGEFFLEALSAFEVVQRVLEGAREAARLERRQAVVLRRLSGFLTDASLAVDAAESLGEMLQLVAEHAREILGVRRCVVRADAGGESRVAFADLAPAGADGAALTGGLAAPLTALDGRAMGLVEVYDKQDGEFSELDSALLGQVAQMASAAVERAALYYGSA